MSYLNVDMTYLEVELWVLLRLVVAAILGGLIGYEREKTGKAAGFRTHMLIAVGAALFVSFSQLFIIATAPWTPPGPAGNFRLQIDPLGSIEAVVAGISFIGAGIIFVSRQQDKVKNLTTAASVWVTAAVGIAVGIERYVVAVGCTLLVLAILRVLPSPKAKTQEITEDTDAPAMIAVRDKEPSSVT